MRFIVFFLCLFCTTVTASEKLVICTYENNWTCIDGPMDKSYKYCYDINETIRVCSDKPIQFAKV